MAKQEVSETPETVEVSTGNPTVETTPPPKKKGIGCCGIFLIVLVALGLLIAFAIFKLTNTPNDQFTLIKESGVVSYRKDDEETFTQLEDDEVMLPENTFVKTGEGYAHILMPNNSMISLDKQTEIRIKFEDDDTIIEQFTGNTWHRLQKLLKGEEYNVETSSTYAAVRGTKFAVEILDNISGETDVYVTQNEVESGTINKTTKKKVLDISEGKLGKVFPEDTGKQSFLEEIPDRVKTRNWYLRNVKLDKDFDKVHPALRRFHLRNLRNSALFDIYNDIPEEGRTVGDSAGLMESILGRAAGLQAQEIPDPQSINDRIVRFEGYSAADGNVCTMVNSPQFAEDIALLESYSGFIRINYSQVKVYFSTLRRSCADGNLSEAETEELSNLASGITIGD